MEAVERRADGRAPGDLRSCSLLPRYLELHPASCLIKTGRTWVLCTASVEERVPPFLEGTGRGWVTGQYAMMPGCVPDRIAPSQNQGGRAEEISRLLGRSLRAAVDLAGLGPRMITVDCQVVQADGGTRTASVTGGYVALALALGQLQEQGVLNQADSPAASVLRREVAAVSVGLVAGAALLDLDYREDAGADADLNVVMTSDGGLVEVQGTAEREPYSRDQLQVLLDLAADGIRSLFEAQRAALTA